MSIHTPIEPATRANRPPVVLRMADAIKDAYAVIGGGVGPDDLRGDISAEDLEAHFGTAAGIVHAEWVRPAGQSASVSDSALATGRRHTSPSQRLNAISLRRHAAQLRRAEPLVASGCLMPDVRDFGHGDDEFPASPLSGDNPVTGIVDEAAAAVRDAFAFPLVGDLALPLTDYPADTTAQRAVEKRPDPVRLERALQLVAAAMPNEAELHLALRSGGFDNLEIAALWPEIITAAADRFAARMGGE